MTEQEKVERIEKAVLDELLLLQESVKKKMPAVIMFGIHLQDSEQVFIDALAMTTVYDVLGSAIEHVSGSAKKFNDAR